MCVNTPIGDVVPTSYNGWSASPDLSIRDLTVGGVDIVPGIRNDDDVYVVLHYIAQQFHERVEPLHPGWCWGFNYRVTTGDPSTLSNHSSATAMDLNAPAHPYSVPASSTFSSAQIAEIHQILAEVDHVVEWGGDYENHPQDGMHFDINGTKAEVAVVADKIRNNMEEEMKAEDWVQIRQIMREEADASNDALLATEMTVTTATGHRRMTLKQLLRETWQRIGR